MYKMFEKPAFYSYFLCLKVKYVRNAGLYFRATSPNLWVTIFWLTYTSLVTTFFVMRKY